MTIAIESIIIESWREILGIENIQVKDDFFELGGDSITVLQLVSMIKKKFSINLNASTILRNPTALQLTEFIKSQLGSPDSIKESDILCMKKGDRESYIPLVLIHAADGDVYIYSNLVNGMPEKYPIYAIRSPMIGNKVNFKSIDEMSKYYLSELEKFGINSPFIIGGSSLGGVIAYHMACLMQKNGKDAPTVISIDAPSHNKLPHGFDEDIVILEYLGKYMFPKLKIRIEELKGLKNTEEQIQYIRNKAVDLGLSEIVPPEFGISYLNTWKAHQSIMNQYVPEPYPGSMIFFSHTEVIPEFPANQYLDWKDLVQGDFQNFPVPGNHSSMNSHPNVETIINHLISVMEEKTNISHNN